MTQAKKIKLYAYKTAPMVQPVVITMLEKGIEYEVELVNAYDKPDWFRGMGPADQMPLLEVDGNILFESAAINEYLDETFGPRLMPEDPIIRAQNRAWISYAFTILMDQFIIMTVRRSEEYEAGRQTVLANYAKVEAAFGEGPYFNGEDISLIDFSYAPMLLRQDILDRCYGTDILGQFEKISAWAKLLIARPSVQASLPTDTPEDFDKLYLASVLDTYLSKVRGGGLSLPDTKVS